MTFSGTSQGFAAVATRILRWSTGVLLAIVVVVSACGGGAPQLEPPEVRGSAGASLAGAPVPAPEPRPPQLGDARRRLRQRTLAALMRKSTHNSA